MSLSVIVCGARDWKKDGMVRSFLSGLLVEFQDITLIEGGAKGADAVAKAWAQRNPVIHMSMPAAWKEHHPEWCYGDWCKARHYCVAAGPRRNQQMLDLLLECDSDRLVVGFKTGFDFTFTKGGTEDMIGRAERAGVPTYVVSAV